MTVFLTQEDKDHDLTFHGKCFIRGKQVAHVDLHVAVAAGALFDSDFRAFNRACDTSAGASVKFFAYTLNRDQFASCAQHPISPL